MKMVGKGWNGDALQRVGSMYVIGQNSIQVRIFQCCLIPNFLCLVTLIHEWLGQGDSKLKGTEIENQPKNHKMLL